MCSHRVYNKKNSHGSLLRKQSCIFKDRQKAVSSALAFAPTASYCTPDSVPHIECATIMDATSSSISTLVASRLGKFLAGKTGQSKWLGLP